jgi:hypothetical protein
MFVCEVQEKFISLFTGIFVVAVVTVVICCVVIG